MTVDEVMEQLKALGKEQTRKTYRRHGAGDNVFGVSYADFEKLRKKIKIDHPLALGLWATGNHDARILAMMIGDPEAVTEAQIDGFLNDSKSRFMSFEVARFIAKTDFLRSKAEAWSKSDDEWTGLVGWSLVSNLAMQDQTLPDAYFEHFLEAAERDIHRSKNWIKYGMNNAVIAIGIRNRDLEAKAVAVAERIGKVEVDHGDTDCKTPDAVPYIRKSWERKRKKAKA